MRGGRTRTRTLDPLIKSYQTLECSQYVGYRFIASFYRFRVDFSWRNRSIRSMATSSRFAVALAIYKTHASPYWFARILDHNTKKYLVRSTKETARVKARKVAERSLRCRPQGSTEARSTVNSRSNITPLVSSRKGRRLAATGDRNANYIRTAQLFVDRRTNGGLMKDLRCPGCPRATNKALFRVHGRPCEEAPLISRPPLAICLGQRFAMFSRSHETMV